MLVKASGQLQSHARPSPGRVERASLIGSSSSSRSSRSPHPSPSAPAAVRAPAAACRGTSAPCQPPAPRPRPRTSAASPRPRSSTSPPTATTTTTTTSTTSLRRARLARGSSRGASTSTPASRPSRLSSPQQAQVRPRPLLFAVAEQASPPKTFPRSHEPLPQSQHRPPSTRSAPTAPHPSLPLASSRRLASDPPATSLSSASSPSLSSSTSPSSASTRGRRWRPGPWATPSRPSRRRWSTSRTA